jgi:hypothetical protein
MHCVKTGASLFIYELGILVAADIYAVGEHTLVARWNLRSVQHVGPIKARELGATHFALEGVRQNDDWCRDDLGVLVTQRRFMEGDLCE